MSFVPALIGGLVQAAGSMAGKVLISLGVGYATYQGIDASFDWIKVKIATSFMGMPAQAMAVLSAARVGSAVSIVLSAIAARMVLVGMVEGAKRLTTK